MKDIGWVYHLIEDNINLQALLNLFFYAYREEDTTLAILLIINARFVTIAQLSDFIVKERPKYKGGLIYQLMQYLQKSTQPTRDLELLKLKKLLDNRKDEEFLSARISLENIFKQVSNQESQAIEAWLHVAHVMKNSAEQKSSEKCPAVTLPKDIVQLIAKYTIINHATYNEIKTSSDLPDQLMNTAENSTKKCN